MIPNYRGFDSLDFDQDSDIRLINSKQKIQIKIYLTCDHIHRQGSPISIGTFNYPLTSAQHVHTPHTHKRCKHPALILAQNGFLMPRLGSREGPPAPPSGWDPGPCTWASCSRFWGISSCTVPRPAPLPGEPQPAPRVPQPPFPPPPDPHLCFILH